MEGAGERGPGADTGAGTGALEVDGRAAAALVVAAAGRELTLVRAPAELGRLAALGDEAVDRPGVDELARALGRGAGLGVALGDVDRLHAEVAEQAGPAFAGGGLLVRQAGVAGDGEGRLLRELGDDAGVGTLGADGGGAGAELAAQRQHALAKGVVRALGRGEVAVEVEAAPGLDDGVEVEDAALVAQACHRGAGDVDREVEEEIARTHAPLDLVAVVLGREGQLGEADAVMVRDLAAARVGGDDLDPVGADAEMAEDERQDGLADAAAADHEQTALEVAVNLVLRHRATLQRVAGIRCR